MFGRGRRNSPDMVRIIVTVLVCMSNFWEYQDNSLVAYSLKAGAGVIWPRRILCHSREWPDPENDSVLYGVVTQ